jgi:glutaredoxin
MKKFLPLILILLVVGAYIFFNSQKTTTQNFPDSEADLILFWGEGCPHCEVVKTHIKDNNLETKVKIAYKEVYYDKENQKLIENTVQKCPEIDSSRGVGVPLAFDTKNSKCLYGDIPIIDWLKAK